MIEITSQQCQVFGVGDSLQGGRPENQDDFGCTHTPLGFLVVLCDGMGGGPGGKTASYLAKAVFMQALAGCSPSASPAVSLRMAVDAAEQTIEARMNEEPSLKGMGSTLAAVLFYKQMAYVVHLGDSRVYQLRGKKMIFRTKDHSLVQELQDRKALTEEQARVSPQSNVIMRGLGNTTNHVAEIEEVEYRSGDRFVLCSDGVWGSMPHPDILDRLTRQAAPSVIVRQLQDEIDHVGFASGGGHDNHTLIMLEARGGGEAKTWDNLWGMSRCTLWLAILSVVLVLSLVFNLILVIKVMLTENTSQLETNSQHSQYEAIAKLKDGELRNSIIIDVLRRDNDSLVSANIRLQKLVDSLRTTIGADKIVAVGDTNSEATVPQQPKSGEDLTRFQFVTPAAMLDSAILLLGKIQGNYDSEQEKIQKANEDRYSTVIQKLREFLAATTPRYDQKVHRVIDFITENKSRILATGWKKNIKKFQATQDASDVVDKIKKSVRAIQEDYKKDTDGNNDYSK